MKAEFLPIVLLSMTIVINACSPFTIVRGSSQSEGPGPIMEMESPSTGYQPVVIDDVQVEVGDGSPAPVQVRISGVLPDACAQIEYTEMRQEASDFVMKVSAIPGGPTCMSDTVPFVMSIPLNLIDLAPGSHSVTVNGVRGEFTLRTGNQAAIPWPEGLSIVKGDIRVDSVKVETGVGSPIPIHAIATGKLPGACAQLGEIRLHRDKNVYFVQLLAYLPDGTECGDKEMPFEVEIPLNTVNLPDGNYSVNVNGTGGGFSLPVQP